MSFSSTWSPGPSRRGYLKGSPELRCIAQPSCCSSIRPKNCHFRSVERSRAWVRARKGFWRDSHHLRYHCLTHTAVARSRFPLSLSLALLARAPISRSGSLSRVEGSSEERVSEYEIGRAGMVLELLRLSGAFGCGSDLAKPRVRPYARLLPASQEERNYVD